MSNMQNLQKQLQKKAKKMPYHTQKKRMLLSALSFYADKFIFRFFLDNSPAKLDSLPICAANVTRSRQAERSTAFLPLSTLHSALLLASALIFSICRNTCTKKKEPAKPALTVRKYAILHYFYFSARSAPLRYTPLQ